MHLQEMSMFPFKLAAIESELQMSKAELRDITNMYIEAEESRQRNVVHPLRRFLYPFSLVHGHKCETSPLRIRSSTHCEKSIEQHVNSYRYHFLLMSTVFIAHQHIDARYSYGNFVCLSICASDVQCYNGCTHHLTLFLPVNLSLWFF